MATIFKVTSYVVDTNDCLTEEDIADALRFKCDAIVKPNIIVESRDAGEWDDDHELNDMNCSHETLEKYFKENDKT